MRYEKKMLILSGDGKGVVLMEKSARGVKFTLRTFDLPPCDELKAGVITRAVAVVRDLPAGVNPSIEFVLDIDEIKDLHFAVFDRKLRLYGTDGKKMWEANVMELLRKNDRRSPIKDDRIPDRALPPLSTPPAQLPMPDGTGIPQSRLGLYGDEALAESDFYTSIDINSQMPRVDKFLDESRILGGLAPLVVAHSRTEHIQPAAEVTAITECADVTEAAAAHCSPTEATPCALHEVETDCGEKFDIDYADMQKKSVASAVADMCGSADGDESSFCPWRRQARYLMSLSRREISPNNAAIKPPQTSEAVKFIRETAFFERTRADIVKLFQTAEKDVRLCELLPDMEWVKVDVEGNVIGVGRAGDAALCYAVAGRYESPSPLGDGAQWLPDDKNIPTGKGYWLIFQNLSNGGVEVL